MHIGVYVALEDSPQLIELIMVGDSWQAKTEVEPQRPQRRKEDVDGEYARMVVNTDAKPRSTETMEKRGERWIREVRGGYVRWEVDAIIVHVISRLVHGTTHHSTPLRPGLHCLCHPTYRSG